jgi:signal transduction histidine kinase/ActR/RegA family two-component response regulator
MFKSRELGFAESAARSRKLTAARLSMAALASLIFVFVLGPGPAFAWLCAIWLGEAWIWVSTSPRRSPTALSSHLHRLTAALLTAAGWAAMGVILWLRNDAFYAVAASAIWASLLVYVATSNYRDRLMALINSSPPVLCMLSCPLIAPHGHTLAPLVCVEFCMLLCILQAASSARTNHRAYLEILAEKEKALAGSRAKLAFLAMMSHEIRTPLNGVLGMAQAMARGELPEAQRVRLNVVRSSGETLLTILNDILDLSKIEAGKLELEQVEFDLADLAHGAQSVYAEAAVAKGLQIRLEIEEAARGVYLGDSTRVRQILHNLISNALKFTERGEVVVVVAARAEGIELAVSDTGVGIPADRLPMLFQKFEQVDATTTRRYGGTGLGLAICRELAETFGGAIRAESVEGRGACFTVFLPLARLRDERREDASATVGDDAESGFEGLRVLVAEDNSVNQLVIRTLLNQVGIDPVIVADGAAAVAAWREREWDVVLMDVQMPVMDGPSATRLIRELEVTTARPPTPIVALTANAMAHQVQEYLEAGMDDVVAKPIEVARLFAALQTISSAADVPRRRAFG